MNISQTGRLGTLFGIGLLACGEPHADPIPKGTSGGPSAMGAGSSFGGGLTVGPSGSSGRANSGASSGTGGTNGGGIGNTTGGTAAAGGAKTGGNSSTGGNGVTAGSSAAGGINSAGGGVAGTPSGSPGSSGSTSSSEGTCPGLPAVTDYGAKGPFDVKVVANTGPDGTYYLFRPDATLGKDGLKHPIAVWGNGILTTPDQYQTLLGHIASHGIVTIACPSTNPERPCLDSGMEWLVKQNTADGPLKGKLDTSKEITIGYSWGGGAAIDTANRPNVKATISIHGMPPREENAWTAMKSPLLLFTSTGDTFVNADTYVTPNYNSSRVDTFYATLQEAVGHLYPLDEGAVSCAAGVLLGGPCAAAVKEQAPIVAWIRLWACDDSNAKRYFFGTDCALCKTPWKAQSKPTGAFQ